MAKHNKPRTSLGNKKLRVVVLAIISIGLFSFILGYWAANWFFAAGGEPAEEKMTNEAPLSGTIPKKLDANQIIDETEVVVIPKDALKKGEEKFSFTKNLGKATSPAVDPFENQKPAPVTAAKEEEKKEKKKEVTKKQQPAKKTVKKEVKKIAKKKTRKPAKKKNVASLKAPAGTVFTVQVGSFANEKDAIKLQQRLNKKGYKAFIKRATVRGKSWRRVQVGSFKTRSAAKRTAVKLKNNEKLPTYVTSVKR